MGNIEEETRLLRLDLECAMKSCIAKAVRARMSTTKQPNESSFALRCYVLAQAHDAAAEAYCAVLKKLIPHVSGGSETGASQDAHALSHGRKVGCR